MGRFKRSNFKVSTPFEPAGSERVTVMLLNCRPKRELLLTYVAIFFANTIIGSNGSTLRSVDRFDLFEMPLVPPNLFYGLCWLKSLLQFYFLIASPYFIFAIGHHVYIFRRKQITSGSNKIYLELHKASKRATHTFL